MSQKPRLDELLVRRGFFPDVHAAQAAVLAGEVIVDEHRETSAGRRLRDDVSIRLKVKKDKDRLGFVSRGGGKLAAALEAFSFDPAGLSCVDLGASTGGFTDCLLQHGAQRVSAVDVGTNQFDWGLRNDPRVSVFEQTNVVGIDVAAVGGPFGLAVSDLSFISLTRVLADVARLLVEDGSFIALIKPQFEVAKRDVGERGIVRDRALHAQSIAKVLSASGEAGLVPQGLTYSPVQGRDGNIEFLFLARRLPAGSPWGSTIEPYQIEKVVDDAHAALGGKK